MSIADMIAKFEEWNNSANETVHNFVETANKALGLIQKLPRAPGAYRDRENGFERG